MLHGWLVDHGAGGAGEPVADARVSWLSEKEDEIVDAARRLMWAD